jgi:hypothetical protein
MNTLAIALAIFSIGTVIVGIIGAIAATNFLRFRFRGDLTGVIIGIAGLLSIFCIVITIAAITVSAGASGEPANTNLFEL